ncbi:cystathionine beta-lyase/cystathionine gamma-synthase [Peribacillus cavernae]|nr:cystathionine beta-lyase/cystathionine gamma-synthase [Peribacillus cavernae]
MEYFNPGVSVKDRLLQAHASIPHERRAELGIRISVGLEDAGDLIDHALED